jgi:nucleoside-diphosphate-sugar epimerase
VLIAVTGASGNMGSALLTRLANTGHNVVALARRPPEEAAPERIRWEAVDLVEPGVDRLLRRAFAGADAVVHLAWGFQPTRDADYLHRLDVGGTAAVVAAATAEHVPHLVHVSSVGAYSPRSGVRPVDESWPVDGIPGLPYSRHKVAAERLLDRHEAVPGNLPAVARVRPSLFASAQAGGSLDRYALPSLTPARVLRHLPVLPLDRGFWVQLMHAEDVADGIARIVEHRATGAFNLAVEPPLVRDDIAQALGARPVHLPWRALRAAAAAAWALRLQPVDPGWLDLAASVPRMSAARAHAELGWQPCHDPRSVLAETLAGMAAGSGTSSASLRPRHWAEQLARLVREGPVSRRRHA